MTAKFLETTGDGIRMVPPRHGLPETELFWKVPPGAATGGRRGCGRQRCVRRGPSTEPALVEAN